MWNFIPFSTLIPSNKNKVPSKFKAEAFVHVTSARISLMYVGFKVVEIMGEELKWSREEKKKQLEMARNFIDTEMGQVQ